MPRLASVLYLAGCIAAANAASSVPIATQPILSTVTVATVTDALSTSFATFLETSTVVLYSTVTSRQRIVTSSVGEQLSIITSTSAVVVSSAERELSTVVETIGLTTIYSVESSSSTSAPATTSTGIPAVVPITSTQTTPVNVVTSTASIPTYSTSLASTSLATAATGLSTGTTSKSSSKKLSSGAAAGIAIGVLVLIGAIAGAVAFVLRRRRRDKRWERKAVSDDMGGAGETESKPNFFSPDARAGYDSMWKKAPIVGVGAVAAGASAGSISEKPLVRPGTATTTSERVSPVSHERGDSSTLGGADVHSMGGGSRTPRTDGFGERPRKGSNASSSVAAAWKTVPNFSTPHRTTDSITALPRIAG